MREQWLPDRSLWRAIGWSIAAVTCFHLAYEFDGLRGLIVGFLFCLVPLARLESSRKAFYVGLGIGFALYAPQLEFFWTIFQAAAIALWFVLAFWVALFVWLSRQAVLHFGRKGLLLIPMLWLGLEFWRSELYYLRFSWLTPGFVFSGTRLAELFGVLGVYGIGLLLFAIATTAWALPAAARVVVLGLAIAGSSFLGRAPRAGQLLTGSQVEVAGVQLEFPSGEDVMAALNRLAGTHPNANLFVLSEYTFTDSIPEEIKKWCRDKKALLIVGGQDPAGEDYFNTAFVIGPEGVVFKQAKSVPIQFFKDGLPARDQKLWSSPWGKLGLAVCYDLSYRGVVDRLVAQGCQALIIPTMDVVDWGGRQHRLHARVAPMRAAELGIPIFRLCSSGISQAIERGGVVTASAPFPGQNAMLSARMVLNQPARMPVDHWLAPMAVGLTGAFMIMFLVKARRKAAPSAVPQVIPSEAPL
jgi:apolipoprotein N-acyltransferase